MRKRVQSILHSAISARPRLGTSADKKYLWRGGQDYFRTKIMEMDKLIWTPKSEQE